MPVPIRVVLPPLGPSVRSHRARVVHSIFCGSRHCEQLRPRLDLLMVEVPTPIPGESPWAASRPLAAESDRAGEVRGSRYADSFRRPVATAVPGLQLLADALVSFGGCSVPALIGPFQTGADLLAKFLDH